MKLYLGLTESSPPHQTRVFVEVNGKLVDLNLAYAAYLALEQAEKANAYELSAFYFPDSVTGFLQRGELALEALKKLSEFFHKNDARSLRGPAAEKITYDLTEIRILPPVQKPEKSIVIGFSDQARSEAIPRVEIPTGFYKLPQTFVTTGTPIVLPKFSEDVDGDACLAIVIGKAGKRVPLDQAWQYVAGVTLLIDITARDINRRESLTTNNLLGKNFPSSTALGPALLLKPERKELEAMEVELSIDGAVKQRFALRDCVFTIEQIVARWSILGIKPGDFIAIGASMTLQAERLQNPVPLKAGFNLRCFSPPLGELLYPVVSARGLRG